MRIQVQHSLRDVDVLKSSNRENQFVIEAGSNLKLILYRDEAHNLYNQLGKALANDIAARAYVNDGTEETGE